MIHTERDIITYNKREEEMMKAMKMQTSFQISHSCYAYQPLSQRHYADFGGNGGGEGCKYA